MKNNCLCKYLSLETLYKILQNDEIFLECPENFNDVFETLDLENTNFYICCFTRSVNNCLMWAHYGDKHHGCKIILDREKYIEKGFEFLEVEYCSRKYRKAKKTDKEKLLIKAKKWSYEKEERIILQEKNKIMQKSSQDPNKYSIPAYIKSIVFGVNVDNDNQCYKNIVSEINNRNKKYRMDKTYQKNGIRLKKAIIKDNEFDIKFKEIK